VKRIAGRWLWLAVPVFAAACASFWSAIGARHDHIAFPHARHIQAKVDCVACHDTIFDQKVLGEGEVLPKESKCMECHRAQKEKGNCAFCHTDPGHPTTYVREEAPHLKIPHAPHLEKSDNCRTCHVELPEPGREIPQPPMAACTNCHEHQAQFANAQCDVCHVDLSRYPIRPVSLFTHEGNWQARHPAAARASGESCSQCHEETFCSECHAKTVATPVELKYPERVDRRFIHRNDFVSRHMIDAQMDPASCNRCHSTSFCSDCHAAQNLTPQAANPRNPHPPDFAFPGSPNNHAIAARQNIATCAACHDQGAQSICVQCHKVGGIGGNPHPASWLAHHTTAELRTNSMCLACHP
jgi:hypothetical protein